MANFHSLLVLLSSLLFFTTPVQNWYHSKGGQIVWDVKCDFIGYDFAQQSSTGEGCGDLCLSISQCTHFAWSYNICCVKTITDPNNVVLNYDNSFYPVEDRCGFVVKDAVTTTMVTPMTAPIPATNTIAALLAAVIAAVVVAIAVAVTVSVGSAVAVAAVQSSNQANQIQGQVAQFLSGGEFFNSQTPVNDLTIPVLGNDQPDDGCGDSSVRFQDGKCYPVLNRGSCSSPYDWITVDPVSLTGGFCYVLGSQGPCRSQKPFQLFGYDVFLRQTLCVNVTAFDSPYFASELEEAFMDTTFNQLLPEYDDYRVFLVTDPKTEADMKNWNISSIRRQGGNTAGLFQLPTRLPLLHSCRPGARNGNNYKCTNPLVSKNRQQLNSLQAVRPAFECPCNYILQATGQCVNGTNKSASCGPSYKYIEAIGQCRSLFQP